MKKYTDVFANNFVTEVESDLKLSKQNILVAGAKLVYRSAAFTFDIAKDITYGVIWAHDNYALEFKPFAKSVKRDLRDHISFEGSEEAWRTGTKFVKECYEVFQEDDRLFTDEEFIAASNKFKSRKNLNQDEVNNAMDIVDQSEFEHYVKLLTDNGMSKPDAIKRVQKVLHYSSL